MSMQMKWAGCVALLLAGVCAGPIAAQEKDTSAEKIRKVLNQTIDFDYSAQDFQDLANHLRTKTGVNFVIEPTIAQQMGLGMGLGGLGLGIPGLPGQNQPNIEFKGKGLNLHRALQQLLAQNNLAYVVLENSVMITFEDDAIPRQMGQRVNVKVENVRLDKALKDLARTTGVNIVIDPRVKDAAEVSVSLTLENTTVENAVRLLTEVGGLKSVRSDNVLFVTIEGRADKMRSETPPAVKTPRNWPGVGVFGNMGGMGFGPAGIAIPQIKIAPPAPLAPPAPPQAAPPAAPFGAPQAAPRAVPVQRIDTK